jgi:SAM-dependent methyltransferase
LLGTADRSLTILELGAGYSPVAPKSDAWRTHVVDHATQDELRAKYATAGVDTSLIEPVDTIWQGGALHEAVPADLLNQVDLIIASHVLEHIPDLIGFLQSASRLVRPGGTLSIALPDRRYCFDCFRPWTTTGGLLEAHHRGMNRHGLKTAFDHMAYSAAADGNIAWGPRPVGEPVLLDPFAAAATTVDLFDDGPAGPYQDYHAWQFTPAGFRLVMLELAALGVTDWQVTTLHGPENFEFFAVLRRRCVQQANPGTLQAERQTLLLAQLAETREQIDFILGVTKPIPARTSTDHQELIAKLADQDLRLREIAETLAPLRAVLRPVRRLWRALRGKSPG